MHNKFFIIDDKLVGTGSFNWSWRAVEFNDENLILTNSPKILHKY
jgi:mitochondrial cardiolipin hydrolase